MVIFNELRITDDKKALIVDCMVEGLDIYNNMYIESIYLDYYKSCSTIGVPSDNAICLFDNTENPDTTVKAKRIRKLVDTLPDTFGTDKFDGGLFYVIVKCNGKLPAEAALFSCGTDDVVDVGIVLDWYSLYKKGMAYISYLASGCNDPCADTASYQQFIFIWHALNSAIAAKDYHQICKVWEKFIRASIPTTSLNTITTGCGCH